MSDYGIRLNSFCAGMVAGATLVMFGALVMEWL